MNAQCLCTSGRRACCFLMGSTVRVRHARTSFKIEFYCCIPTIQYFLSVLSRSSFSTKKKQSRNKRNTTWRCQQLKQKHHRGAAEKKNKGNDLPSKWRVVAPILNADAQYKNRNLRENLFRSQIRITPQFQQLVGT